MSNREKYEKVFINSFSIERSILTDKFVYQSVPEWDSVGHMGLIAELEDAFDISMEMDDIIDFSSYKKGIEILKKIGVDI
mgnify:CR=1 FL=1